MKEANLFQVGRKILRLLPLIKNPEFEKIRKKSYRFQLYTWLYLPMWLLLLWSDSNNKLLFRPCFRL